MGTTWSFTGGSLPSGATLTRASTGTYFNASGVLTTAAVNAARFDHQPASPFAARGILIEPAATTLQYYSNDLSQTTYWPLYQGNFETTTTLFVDGVTYFGKTYDNYAYDQHSVSTTATLTVGTGYKISFFVTADQYDGNSFVQLNTGSSATDGTQQVNASFTLSTGAISFAYGNGGGFTSTGSFILAMANGVYLVSLDFSAQPIVSGVTPSFALSWHYGGGDAASGWLLGGVNVKTGVSTFDSYIPTAGAATASRSADALTITVPSGATQLTFTFDDASTQVVSVSPGSYTVPTNLNRPWITQIQSNESGGSATTGTLSKTAGATTSAISANVSSTISGTVASTSGATTLSAAGQVLVSGSVSKTAGATTASAAGQVLVSGTLSKSTGATAASISASVSTPVSASLNYTLNPTAGAISASIITGVAGAVNVSTRPTTSAVSVGVAVGGTVAAATGQTVASINGGVTTPVLGVVGVSTGATTAAIVGYGPAHASVNVNLGRTTAAIVGISAQITYTTGSVIQGPAPTNVVPQTIVGTAASTAVSPIIGGGAVTTINIIRGQS